MGFFFKQQSKIHLERHFPILITFSHTSAKSVTRGCKLSLPFLQWSKLNASWSPGRLQTEPSTASSCGRYWWFQWILSLLIHVFSSNSTPCFYTNHRIPAQQFLLREFLYPLRLVFKPPHSSLSVSQCPGRTCLHTGMSEEVGPEVNTGAYG